MMVLEDKNGSSIECQEHMINTSLPTFKERAINKEEEPCPLQSVAKITLISGTEMMAVANKDGNLFQSGTKHSTSESWLEERVAQETL